MNCAELINEVRSLLNDSGVESVDFTDERIIFYLNSGIDQVCFRTALIIDSTSNAALIDVCKGESVYKIHPSVYKINSAKINGRMLNDTGNYKLGVDQLWNSELDKPKEFVIDMDVNSQFCIRLNPVPDDDYELCLTVLRTPLKPLINHHDTPELPIYYHAFLLNWVCYQLLLTSGHDSNKAEHHKHIFDENVGYQVDAKSLENRRVISKQRNALCPL